MSSVLGNMWEILFFLMRQIITVLLAVLSVLFCFAQTEVEESLEFELLHEVIVEPLA